MNNELYIKHHYFLGEITLSTYKLYVLMLSGVAVTICAEPATSAMPTLRRVAEVNTSGIPAGTTLHMPLNLDFAIKLDNSSQQLGHTSVAHTTSQHVTQDVHQHQEQHLSIENRVSVFVVRMAEKVKKYKEHATTFAKSHKGLMVAGTLVGTYAAVLYGVLSGNSYLENADLWSEWNADMGDDLLTIPQQEVAQALIREIQERYVNGQNPSDFISPFIAFVKDIEEEQKWLERYNSLYSYLEPIGGTYVFPFDEELYVDLEEKIARLTYLKNVYHAWIAEYKIVQHADKLMRKTVQKEMGLITHASHAAHS
jgi:hypothetical protein